VRRESLPLCIGQKQRWFLLRLGALESALRFDSTEQPAEFDRWRWSGWWDAVRDVIYFKRRVYSRALHELGTHAFPEGLPAYPDWWGERMGSRRRAGPGTGD
jgi:putative (di)nucleoside polyphosphate hydrolase